jgi:hypothetical protein
MPILPGQIPADRFADPAEGEQYGKQEGPTWAEAVARGNHRLERKLHADFSGFLKRHEDKIALVHHTNPTKRTRATIGEPDYCIHFMSGKTLFIEFKVSNNTLSPEQLEITGRLKEAGFRVLVTGDYAEAISIAQSLF